MNCKICNQKYQLTNNNKLPRVLTQCGHTFCTQCIIKGLVDFKINCQQCSKINISQNYAYFPVNQTLLALLKTNQTNNFQYQHQHQTIKEQQMCKLHNKKLQAFCQSDNELLCLNCLLSSHKSHKVSSIAEKVNKDKQILSHCYSKLLQSKQLTQTKYNQTIKVMNQMNVDFKQYVFEINLLNKNIITQLKESQQEFIKKSQKILLDSLGQLQKVQVEILQKQSFLQNLQQIYHQLLNLDEIEYLNEGNKRIFIVENCQLRDGFKIEYKKNELNRGNVLNSAIKMLEELVQFQRKKAKEIHQKFQRNQKNIRMGIKNSPSTSNHYKSTSDRKQSDILLLSGQSLIQQSPSRFQKKQSSLDNSNLHNNNQNKLKQPQILQVNLSQQYEKYQQIKNKKRVSQHQTSHINNNIQNNKHTKIQYEIRKQPQDNNNNNNNKTTLQKDKKTHSLIAKKSTNKIQGSSGTKVKQIDLIQTKTNRMIMNVSLQSTHKRDNSLSLLNQSDITYSPIVNYHSKQFGQTSQINFEISTPLSINSFMNSSRFTITGQKEREETMLKDSRASFTMFEFDEKVYHFGGLMNDSITCTRMNQENHHDVVYKGINRNKCQCVMLKGYNTKKCLILGGKDANGQRNNSILEFDINTNKLQKSHLYLNQSISGFGAVVIDQTRLYIFGGNSTTSLKTMYEYRVTKMGFEVKKLASMINSRDELGFALGFDGYVYACGGINTSNVILNTCERYDHKTKKWTSIPAMKHPRRSFTLVSLPNGIYAIGGHDGKNYLKSVQLFDYELQRWIEVIPMNQGRFTHSALATNDYQSIYIFGGYQNEPLKTVQKYSVIENKWTYEADMLSQRFLHCSFYIQH